MVDRRDVEKLTADQRTIVELALDELRAEVARWDLSDPRDVREALFEIVPALVREYGDIAADAAAEWYEDVRPGGRFTARTVESIPLDEIQADLGYHTRNLAGMPAPEILASLSGAMQRHIAYSARETIARNVEIDPLEPRFARVPTGAKTCAWCDMLSSRGFVYRTRESAGESAKFHPEDDCQIVPEWEAERAHIDGYDPDAAYDRYLRARAEVEADGLPATDKEIARRLRDMHPHQYTDSRLVPSLLTDTDAGWPGSIKPVTPGRWRHVLKRHNPLSGRASRFPEGTSDYEIARIIRDVLTAPDATAPHVRYSNVQNYSRLIRGREYLVGVTTLKDGTRRISTAFPPEPGNGIL